MSCERVRVSVNWPLTAGFPLLCLFCRSCTQPYPTETKLSAITGAGADQVDAHAYSVQIIKPQELFDAEVCVQESVLCGDHLGDGLA